MNWKKWEVCICGHAEYEHDFDVGNTMQILRRGCKKCACNEWELIGKMSLEEWDQYKKDNEIDPISL